MSRGRVLSKAGGLTQTIAGISTFVGVSTFKSDVRVHGGLTVDGTTTLSTPLNNTSLANNSVSYGGISVQLGTSDNTPAFNLTDATGYPTSSLVGTITNAQLAGSIANSKLANDNVVYGGVSLALGGTDATPAFDLQDATGYPTSSLVGTITNAQLAGSIANSKLTNSSTSVGGVTLTLGATDATPAFDLSDATNYPTSSLSGTITNAQLAGSIANAKLSNSSITVTDGSNSTATALGGTITFSGTGNEVEVSESSGTVTIGLPSNVTIGNNLTVTGNLQVDGDTTVVNTATMSVEDKNIEIAKGAANDAAADGAGITIDSGDGDKTWNWIDSTDSWTSSEHIDLASGKGLKLNNTTVLSGTTLGSSIVTSSLTTLGTITTGVWNGTAITNANLQHNTVSFGGISLALGGTDATPAFDLSDATNYPTSSLSGTITNAQLAGSIASSKLASSGVSAGTVGSSTAIPIITVNAQGQITSTSTTAIDQSTIENGTASVAVASDGPITSTGNHDFTAGIDVTGNITVTGTVDGRDVATDGTKLDGIEASATADQTDEEIQDIVGAMLSSNTESGITVTYQDADGTIDFAVASQTDENFTTADHAKLDGIEASATADQSDTEIKTAYENNSDTNALTDTLLSKLNAIEAGATADQTAEEIQDFVGGMLTGNTETGITVTYQDGDGTIDFAVASQTDQNFTNADHTKLDGIETSATADQTGAEIKSLYEAESDTNAFTDADHSKLDGIEASATADQTGAEIKSAYEGESDTNALTDTLLSKLNAIEAGATADQTSEEIQDIVGGMLSSNTESGITVTYQDSDGTIDFAVASQTDENFTTADHSKLDGIEASATADQTASEILTLIKTVDGSGSGLDADTLDGISSASLLRSDTSDTFTGTLTVSGAAAVDNLSLDGNTLTTSSGDLTIDSAGGTTTIADNAVISGNLTVNGTTTTVNATTVNIADKNIQVATGAADDAAADGGGITVDSGDGDKTFQFEATGDNFGSSENMNLASGKAYKINNTSILNATTLGSSVVASSLTSVGTIATGVWNGTAITNANLANSTVSYGGVSLSLGGTDATPAFDLSDATNYPTSSLSGTITNAQLAGSIASSKLADTGVTAATVGSGSAIPIITVNAQGQITGTSTASIDSTAISEGNSSMTVDDSGTGSIIAAIDGSTLATFAAAGITLSSGAFVGNLTGNVTGNTSGSSGSCTGNAATATKLAATKTIAGVAFDGSANISLNNNAITNGAGYVTSNTQLSDEQVQDIVGAMVSGNTESGITVTYQDGDGTIDFAVTSQTDNNFTNADHSKLDGIEASATADQTASEILTLIKTVDGAGSGLDADSLDGISSASFVRSDTADGITATLTARAITPEADSTYDLGTDSVRWANVYADDLRTGDLHLSNEHRGGNTIDGSWGHYTIEEGEDDLFIMNKRSGKKFRFVLEQV